MKLKAKILSLSLIPVILLGISMFLVAADRIANGIGISRHACDNACSAGYF